MRKKFGKTNSTTYHSIDLLYYFLRMTTVKKETAENKTAKKVAYTKQSGSKIAFSILLEDTAITQSFSVLVKKYQQNVSIKGFRKGHAPRERVIASVGLENLTSEAFERTLNKVYQQFLIDNEIFPVGQPQIDVKNFEEKPVKVDVVVEIQPEVALGDYKKIKTSPVKIDVKETEIHDVLETIMTDMQLGKVVSRAAKKNDLVTVDFVAKDEKGVVLPKTDGKNMSFRLGLGHYLPDLEAGYEGMKAGEEKKVSVSFPAEYQSKDMAGKTVEFEIKLHEVKEISYKNIDESMVEKIIGEKKTIDDLKEQIKEVITTNKTKTERKKAIDAYKKELVKKVKIDLPESWIKSETEDRMSRLKSSPAYQASPEKFWKNLGKTETEMEKEFETLSSTGLTEYLALLEIVKTENIELDKDEAETVHQRVHRELGSSNDHSSNQHERLMGQFSLDAKIDKYLNALFS